jgi:hypothetical protein
MLDGERKRTAEIRVRPPSVARNYGSDFRFK